MDQPASSRQSNQVSQKATTTMRRQIITAAGAILLLATGTWSTASSAPAPADCGGGTCVPAPSPARSAPAHRTLSRRTGATFTMDAHRTTSSVPGSHQSVVLHPTILHITGSGFTPGSMARMAVMNTAQWQLLDTGATRAQSATISVICDHDFQTCLRPNPRAGTITYHLLIDHVPVAAHLIVLYRTGTHTGMRAVSVQ